MTIAEQVIDIFDRGYKAINVTLKDGRIQRRRLFQKDKMVCVYNHRSKNWGRDVHSPLVTEDWVSVEPAGKNKEQTFYEWYIKNIIRYKRAFSTHLHPNLWSEYRQSYEQFSVDAFKAYVEGSQIDTNDRSALYQSLVEYCKIFNIKNVITNNRYKTESVRSNAPLKYTDRYQYDAYMRNIDRHLDNKEDFHYSWKSRYRITVSGKLCSDGVYRAWFSQEFMNSGNGHYFVLVNSNMAVFSEDD